MSKLIILPFAVAAAPLIGAVRVAKKVSDALEALSPEDWDYFLPFGAAKERLRLEQASVTYQPLDGIEFNGALLDFKCPQDDPDIPVSVPQLEYMPSISFEKEALAYISSEVEQAGFKTELRALPQGANIAVFDLFQPEVLEPLPALVGERHGVKKN